MNIAIIFERLQSIRRRAEVHCRTGELKSPESCATKFARPRVHQIPQSRSAKRGSRAFPFPGCVRCSFWVSQPSQPVSLAESARTTCQMVTARSRTARTDVALALQASPRHVKKPLLVKSEPVSPSFYFKGSITQQNGKHRDERRGMRRTSRARYRRDIHHDHDQQTMTAIEHRTKGWKKHRRMETGWKTSVELKAKGKTVWEGICRKEGTGWTGLAD